jgi:hypothetical protein
MTTNFFHSSLLLLFLDPGSEIRDPGWVKIWIRDKHPGSATLISRMSCELGLDLLQSYLRELPSPLFGEGLYADWLEAGNLSVHAFHTLCRFSVHI